MVESVNIEWNLAYNRVDGFASSRFFDRVNCADNRVERGANRVDLSTTESILITIESVFAIESVLSIELVYQSSRFITIESIPNTIESILEPRTAHFLDRQF